MAIRMQGAWTIQVLSRNAAESHRFIITGADIGSGVHDGAPGKMVFVRGQSWSITLQRRHERSLWTESQHRIGATSVAHGLVEFDIRARSSMEQPQESGMVLVCMRLAGRLELVRGGPIDELRACA